MDADRSSPDPWATGRRRSGRPDRGVRRATPPRYDDAGPGPAGRGAPASGTPAPGGAGENAAGEGTARSEPATPPDPGTELVVS
ncbi:hypothetical protein GSF26_27285, partial [Pseudonocardia alni]|nr:hypothetical protein [Pseudonocardia alni]